MFKPIAGTVHTAEFSNLKEKRSSRPYIYIRIGSEQSLMQPEQATAHATASETSSQSDHLETVENRLGELEAAVKALETYVGQIERTDDELERQANAAIAAVDQLEDRVENLEQTTATATTTSQQPDTGSEPNAPTQSSSETATEIDEESTAGLLEKLRTEL